MGQLIDTLGTAGDLALVLLGFGFIIFIHELGHFVAAKWAGIRVLAFAIGFGPALASYRKGLGVRVGSSEPEYRRLLAAEGHAGRGFTRSGVSPTEYRLNWLPLGGYVKMLGQEDLNPSATSPEQDSYQRTPVRKRMVVISAGVVMNILLAGILFIIVFMTGLKTMPARIGSVVPGSAGAQALPISTAAAEPGLRPGDTVITVNGRRAEEFTDLSLASAMAARGQPVRLEVQRPGVELPLVFDIVPRTSESSKLQELGVEPFRSTRLLDKIDPASRPRFDESVAKLGLPGLEPGAVLLSVNGRPAASAEDIATAARHSGGAPIRLVFENPGGGRVEGALEPVPRMQLAKVEGTDFTQPHLLGLLPVMRVGEEQSAQGLRPGDIFARIGNVEFPSFGEGVREIRGRKGGQVEVEVLRPDTEGKLQRLTINPPPRVNGQGRIGFSVDDTAEVNALVAMPPGTLADASREDGPSVLTPAAAVIKRPGTRVLSVDGRPVATLVEAQRVLREATAGAYESGRGAAVDLELALPLPEQPGGGRPVQRVSWALSESDVRTLHTLGWSSPLSVGVFEPEEFVLKARNPAEAVRMGLARTHRVMLTTYLTFVRLFQGTVKVEHLKGPVGIAHMGTRLAEKGMVWLLFYMALISVNLAVINFLPLPIVDGGQFVFLALEGVRRRPVSAAVQNAATIAGLLLIGTMFVIVTYHDIAGLF
jgi:regulator of sigma E protease